MAMSLADIAAEYLIEPQYEAEEEGDEKDKVYLGFSGVYSFLRYGRLADRPGSRVRHGVQGDACRVPEPREDGSGGRAEVIPGGGAAGADRPGSGDGGDCGSGS